jgi:hypothetical protein
MLGLGKLALFILVDVDYSRQVWRTSGQDTEASRSSRDCCEVVDQYSSVNCASLKFDRTNLSDLGCCDNCIDLDMAD